MSRYEEFKAADVEIEALAEWLGRPSGGDAVAKFLTPLAEARVQALKALFDEPTPPPVEPVKVKAAKGAVDAAVQEQWAVFAQSPNFPANVDWTAWAKAKGLNKKSVLGAVRRHTEKAKA